MKLIKILLSIIIFLSSTYYASETSSCATISGTASIPFSGTMKVYIVFAQFKDDPNNDNLGWSKNQYPTWANTFVNPTAGGTYPWANLSHYYNEMSNGTFQVIGDVYNSLVKTDSNESYYSSIGAVNREILLKVESSVDFSEYDFLDGSTFGSDDVVDLIIIIYRNVTRSVLMSYSGVARLNLDSTITADNVSIINHSSLGGGVQQRGGYLGKEYTLYVAAHELGHYLFGGGHISNAANLCLMSSQVPVWSGSKGMHSWERNKLGWITYTNKSTDGSVTLSDYMTADNVYRVPVNGDTEYFLIENRKKISVHDKAGDTGFYFYRITNGSSFPPTIDVLCADGNWDFDVNTTTQTLEKDTPNPLGKDEMNFYSNVSGVIYRCITPIYNENSAWGDTEDAFDLSYNNVLNPISNPRSTNGGSIEFSLEVTGTSTVTFYVDGDGTNEYAGSPSKPQDLRVIPLHGHPLLSWDPNTEPDISRYYIYRDENGTGYSYIGSTTSTSYQDTEVDSDVPSDSYHYKIKAKDTQGKYSVYSESTSIDGFMAKSSQEKTSYKIDFNYDLFQNFPNPFNPETIISYTLAESGFTSIEIFNSIGERIDILEKSYQSVGKHNVVFNGKQYPSGIYYYKITSGKFSQTKKMILMK